MRRPGVHPAAPGLLAHGRAAAFRAARPPIRRPFQEGSTMSALHWNASGSKVLDLHTQARWRAIGRGLALVLGGYVVLCTLALAGIILAWQTTHGGPPARARQQLVQEGQDVPVVLGLRGAVVLGYLLVLVGQWVCLRQAPHSHGAKELL